MQRPTETYYRWDPTGDQAAQGDYDGDGNTDFSIYRGGTTGHRWVTRSITGTYYATPHGTTGDKPVPGDYDGDGKTDLALFRSSNHTWYIIRSSDSTAYLVDYDSSGDMTTQSDYDGDDVADLWTLPREIPVQNEYDGDGNVDIAKWRLIR